MLLKLNKSRTLKFDEATFLTFCRPLQQNLQQDVTLILRCLMQGENMTDLDNEKVIDLVQ